MSATIRAALLARIVSASPPPTTHIMSRSNVGPAIPDGDRDLRVQVAG